MEQVDPGHQGVNRVTLTQWFSNLSWGPPTTAYFVCLSHLTHLIQLISSLVESARLELGVAYERDIQNMWWLGVPRTGLRTTALTDLVIEPVDLCHNTVMFVKHCPWLQTHLHWPRLTVTYIHTLPPAHQHTHFSSLCWLPQELARLSVLFAHQHSPLHKAEVWLINNPVLAESTPLIRTQETPVSRRVFAELPKGLKRASLSLSPKVIYQMTLYWRFKKNCHCKSVNVNIYLFIKFKSLGIMYQNNLFAIALRLADFQHHHIFKVKI